MFWFFTVQINWSSNLKIFENSQPSAPNFNSFSRLLEQFFLTFGQNNFENKIPFLFFKKKLKFKFGIFLKCFYFSFSRCGIQQSKQFKRIEFRGRSQAGGHFKGHFRCHFALVTTIHRATGQSAPFSAYEHYSRPFRSTSRPNKIK